jgi:hypothetical protein
MQLKQLQNSALNGSELDVSEPENSEKQPALFGV